MQMKGPKFQYLPISPEKREEIWVHQTLHPSEISGTAEERNAKCASWQTQQSKDGKSLSASSRSVCWGISSSISSRSSISSTLGTSIGSRGADAEEVGRSSKGPLSWQLDCVSTWFQGAWHHTIDMKHRCLPVMGWTCSILDPSFITWTRLRFHFAFASILTPPHRAFHGSRHWGTPWHRSTWLQFGRGVGDQIFGRCILVVGQLHVVLQGLVERKVMLTWTWMWVKMEDLGDHRC